jgi:hypothetical protein
MDYTALRKRSLTAFIGFLSLTAAIAIVSVLAGDFGEIQVKILSTTFTISAASIACMACAAFIERHKAVRIGFSGIALSVAAATLIIIGLWTSTTSEEYWKTTGSFIVVAIAFAHAFLLMIPDLNHRYKWIQTSVLGAIGLLSLQILFAIWGEIENEFYFRLLTVVAIIVGLETLIIPIVMKMQKTVLEKDKQLILDHISGERYQDSEGQTYTVTKLPRD